MTRQQLTDDDLKQALQGMQMPTPDPHAQKTALEAGLAAFDEKNAKSRQGSSSPLRLISMTTSSLKRLGDWIMKPNVIAATSFGVITALTLLVVSQTSNIDQPTTTDNPVASITPQPPNQNQVVSQPAANDRKLAKIAENVAGGTIETVQAEPSAQPEGTDATIIGQMDSVASIDEAKPAEQLAEAEMVAQTAPALSMNAPPPAALSPAKKSRTHRQPAIIGGIVSPAPRLEFYDALPTEQNHDKFTQFDTNAIKQVAQEPVSTFSADVDSASYSFVRRQLDRGILPNPSAVRVEEMVNYFDYNYPVPEDRDTPFKPTVAIHPTPWNPDSRLLHIGIKGFDLPKGEKPRSNLVFLLDVSGSMSDKDKLPLLKSSLRLLLGQLQPEDSVAIVVYAGAAGEVLKPTKVAEKHKILAALDQLEAGGSTAGGAGIQLAYNLAEANFDKKAVNRIILATDGDFNVGVSDPEALKQLISKKRESGVFLSVLGFGQGNLNDQLMQTLAQNGNGIAAHIDTLHEARKVLVEEAAANLFPIAKDVKFQIEFNPARVAEYRLIGYETRHLKREDFNNDKIDAGDMGAGHTVTALYEITPVGSQSRSVDPLRYGKPEAKPAAEPTGEWAFLKMRYKLPNGDKSRLITRPVTDEDVQTDLDKLPADLRFATAVAAFGQQLRSSQYLKDFDYAKTEALAQGARGDDPYGRRAELVNLVRQAKALEAAR